MDTVTFSDDWSEQPTVRDTGSPLELAAWGGYNQGHRDGFSCGVMVAQRRFWSGVAVGAWMAALLAILAAVTS